MRLVSVLCVLLAAAWACSADADKQDADQTGYQDSGVTEVADSTTHDAPYDAPAEIDAAPQKSWKATLTLPEFPFWENQGMAIDIAQLQPLADAYCQTAGAAGNAPEFFYGTLPLWAVGGLCPVGDGASSPALLQDDATVQSLLGWMYLSGFYGGVWFRDNADFGMSMPGGGEGEGGPEPGPVTEESFMPIADNALLLRQLATSGPPAEVFAHNLEALKGTGSLLDALMTSLLTVFAYNYGYVQAVLAKPPADVQQIPAFPCADYLSCKLAKSPLAQLALYEAALPLLKSPPNDAWKTLAAEVDKSKTWIGIGKGLWSEGTIGAEAWGVLVLINAGYLQVSAAAALASTLGYGNGDEPAGRCGTLLEAAADTWNQAYFLALRSDAPVGAAPVLVCEER